MLSLLCNNIYLISPPQSSFTISHMFLYILFSDDHFSNYQQFHCEIIHLYSWFFYQPSLISIKQLQFLPFSPIITKPSRHHSFPDSPPTEFMRRQAARLSVYYVLSLLSHSCLTNIETWPSVPLHSLSQDFYLSGDLILIKSDWIGRYFCGKVPGAHGAHILNASNCCARFDINQPFTRDHFICLEDHRCPTYWV